MLRVSSQAVVDGGEPASDLIHFIEIGFFREWGSNAACQWGMTREWVGGLMD
jgi:hypothetical protein